ncbi:unnamed protein product [Orchesella dallaii]|uniref:Uncharacterized protein n=1 Tax=Orchesella dallaii TaxID=48710 RepID=A0ABP1RSG3_9HEXA
MSSLPEFSKNELLLERKRFNAWFPTLLKDILTEKENLDVPWALAWLKEVCLYNVPHGKQIRGLLVPLAVRGLGKCPTEKQIEQSYILGWCVEMVRKSILPLAI